jgi:anti-sigma regulatory factor (Ser/Thr protein kinase)
MHMLDTSDVPGPPDVRLTLPAVRESVSLARHVLAGLIAAQPLSPRRQEQALLALSEAATSAVLHAGGDHGRPSHFVVEGRACPDRLVLVVTGSGARPRLEPPGAVAGLSMIAQIADQVGVNDVPGGGTEVRMAFALGEPEVSAPPRRTLS